MCALNIWKREHPGTTIRIWRNSPLKRAIFPPKNNYLFMRYIRERSIVLKLKRGHINISFQKMRTTWRIKWEIGDSFGRLRVVSSEHGIGILKEDCYVVPLRIIWEATADFAMVSTFFLWIWEIQGCYFWRRVTTATWCF